MSSHDVAPDEPIRKVLLSVGFLALAASVLLAHTTPATGYEVSIYTMTPLWVWAGLALALAVSLGVSLAPSTSGRGTRPIALVLGGLAVTVVAGLPIIRGYHFFGHHDALTHLGWARGISEGAFSPFDLFYPGLHTTTVFVNSVVDVPLESAMLLVVLFTTMAFVVFVPLSVGTIVPDSLAVTIAAFGAFLLLPITTISTFMHPHSMTQTILLFALFVYLLLKYVTVDEKPSLGLTLLFALVATSAVVYHPQYVAHMLVVCLGICAVQFLAPRLPYLSGTSTVRQIADHQRLYGQTLFLIAIFLVWSANYGFFSGFAERAISSAASFLLTGSGQAGASIAQQGGSLAAIGVSLGEIFVKLFFAHLVVTLLAGLLILAVVFTGRPSRFPDVPAVTMYLGAGLVGLAGLFVTYFASVTSEMYFRVFSLMMVFLVILASIAIHEGVVSLSNRFSAGPVRTFAAGAIAILLVLSLASVFASPYIYGQSHHVSEQQMHGYETAFDNAADETDFAGLRGAPDRYADAIDGRETRSRAHVTATADTFEQGPGEYYDEDRYLVVSQVDYDRELLAYHGIQYSESDFDSLDDDPALNRVHSNGEVTTYQVSTEATA
ncbi:MFS transporter [Natrialbaceae archaeon A-arb3/5]